MDGYATCAPPPSSNPPTRMMMKGDDMTEKHDAEDYEGEFSKFEAFMQAAWGGDPEELMSIMEALEASGRVLEESPDHRTRHQWNHLEVWDSQVEPLLTRAMEICQAEGIPFQFMGTPYRDEEGTGFRGARTSTEAQVCEVLAASLVPRLPHQISHFLIFLGGGLISLSKIMPSEMARALCEDMRFLFGASMSAVAQTANDDEENGENDD